MYVCLHVTYPLFFSDFNEDLIVSTESRKYSKVQFNEDPEGTVKADGRTGRRTDMTQLIVAFLSTANAPKSFTSHLAIPRSYTERVPSSLGSCSVILFPLIQVCLNLLQYHASVWTWVSQVAPSFEVSSEKFTGI
jgi:hypothetical protein